MEDWNQIYFSNIEMKETFEELDGFSLQCETDDYFEVLDTYDTEGRIVRFHKESFELTFDMLDTFGHDVGHLDLFTCMSHLPKIMFMNVKKIYIGTNQGDIDSLNKELQNSAVKKNVFGSFLKQEGIVFINLEKHEEQAEKLLNQKGPVNEVKDYDILLKELVWKTLVFQIYRSFQSNPLMLGILDTSEEAANEFCEELFLAEKTDQDGRTVPVTLDIDVMHNDSHL